MHFKTVLLLRNLGLAAKGQQCTEVDYAGFRSQTLKVGRRLLVTVSIVQHGTKLRVRSVAKHFYSLLTTVEPPHNELLSLRTWYRENVANYRRIFSAVFFVHNNDNDVICCYSLWPVFRRHVVGHTSFSVVRSCWNICSLYWTASNNATLLLRLMERLF